MTQAVWDFISGFGEIWYPLFLGVTAMVETLFPPFPGDVIYIALAGLGTRSGVSWPLLWAPGFAGCFASTLILDRMGRSSRLEKLERLITGSSRRNGMERASGIISRHGPWIITASRFIPGIRSILVIAAASSGMKRSSVLFYAGLSASLWYLLMVMAGHFAGEGIESAERFMADLSIWLLAGAATMVLLGAGMLFFKLRRTE